MAEQNQADRAEVLESACGNALRNEVTAKLHTLTDDVWRILNLGSNYAKPIIKFALHIYMSNFLHEDGRRIDGKLRFRTRGIAVFVTKVYDMLPFDALKNFRKYDAEAFRMFIETSYADVDVSPYLEPPADYRPE